MTSQDRPQLDLGVPPGRLKPSTGAGWGKWLAVLALLQLATLAAVLIAAHVRPGRGGVGAPAGDVGEDSRAVALELENRSLYGESARAWERYLATPGTESRAEILYRIGKLYMQAEDYGAAAAALVRAELAANDTPELRDKIGPVMVDCLRRLGLYGEVGRELSRRVEAGADKTGQRKVLATVAGEEICEADLDRMIERRVDQMLGLQGVPGDESTRQMLLKRLSEPQTRQQLFQELLQRELFTRRARELKLDRDEGFQQARRMLEEDLLAKSFQEREVGKIQPTDVDVQAYYQAHAEQYRQPESLGARLLPLQSGEEPGKLLDQIKSAEDFQRLAAERAAPAGKDGAGTPPAAETLIRGREHEKLGNTDKLFTLEAGKWTEQPVVHRGQRWLVLVESKTPARPLPLEEVRPQVEAEYRAQKQQELARKLFQELVTRYQVQLSPPEPLPSEKGKR